MKRTPANPALLLAAVCVIVLAIDTQFACGQTPVDGGCIACHSCATPNPDEPCLRPCSRELPVMPIHVGAVGEIAPDVVMLDQLVDRYLPVPFDHKGHARMAAMGAGCETCHHFTPAGQAHPACRTCHETGAVHTDIHKPGLRGAYHRQCLNCHREWSGDEQCSACHQARLPNNGRHDEPVTPTTGDLIGRMHPPISEPDTEFFTARAAGSPGSRVIFRHKEHIHRFGFTCAECHHEDSCVRCHAPRDPSPREMTVQEHHQPCLHCHQTDMSDDQTRCTRCHVQEGSPLPPEFAHATVGWALSRYHASASCRDCHKSVRFVALDRDCNGCHAGWSPDTFDHAVTGQTLDAMHVIQDCDVCHLDRDFAQPPTCDECHDPEDGIAFPAQRPGPWTPPDGPSAASPVENP